MLDAPALDEMLLWSEEQALAERFALAVTQLNRQKGVLVRLKGRVTLGGSANDMVIAHRAAGVRLDQSLPVLEDLLQRQIKPCRLDVARVVLERAALDPLIDQANAQAIVAWLRQRDDVARIHYPGFGGMISFVLSGDLAAATRFVKATTLFTLAESLGGVESLIELPAVMTHASVPPDIRAAIGIPDGLIRLSVGIEHVDDLLADLDTAFSAAHNG